MKRAPLPINRSAALLALAALAACAHPDPGSRSLDGRNWPDAPSGPRAEVVPCEVTRIVDGDTLHCGSFGSVRLIGIDSPEAGQSELSTAATGALETLVPVGSAVQLELGVEAQDRYGRTLGYVWSDGVLVNWVMVRSGYAVTLTYPPNVAYVDAFRAAQEAAREDAEGLWAQDGFRCEPVAFRRGDCS